MPRPLSKNFRDPHEIRRFPNGQIETITHHETTTGRIVLQPGWRWSRDVGPIAGTRSCQVHHVGVVLKGTLHLETDAGERFEFEPGDVYDIPPGHDAWVGGNETFQAIEFAGARIFAAPADGERVLAALLITDIVMPEMDGIELARRATEIDPDIKVMFITGFAAVALNPDNNAPRQAKILSKPFHLKDLVNEVQRLLAA